MNTPLNFLSPDEFRNPPARPRIAPFWFWNCDMDEARVRHQVRQMARSGCGGFFIHPRQGLTTPYLSHAWFARVRVAVEEARSCGLEAWLYDEYPYPSGIAGGLVTANRPEFRARELKTFDFPVAGGQLLRREFPMGRVVSALACPLRDGAPDWNAALDIGEQIGVVLTQEQFWYWPMGHISTNEKRFMAGEGRLVLEWTPPAGEWQIFVGIEVEQRGFKYYDCFFDPLCPGAAEEFIRLTHERYAAELGEFFGNTIPGIFSDETEAPAWSPQIEKALGLDALDVVALRRDDHPRAAEVRLAFKACALQLFGERWEKPMAAWCREHHLIWGAEKPKLRPAQFWNVGEPATDAGHRRLPAPPEPLTADLRANHRAAMSAAEQNGGETVRCECFHSLGWGATLQDQKWQFDWLCVQGVNRFTPHAFYGTSAGLKKHDAAPSFFAENPYWKHFPLLAEYAARLCLAMSSGRERARLALLFPHDIAWSGGDAAREAVRTFNALQNDLLERNIPFHIADTRAFTKATARAGALEIGRARYETVLAPVPSPEIEAALDKARAAGLTIAQTSDLESPLRVTGGAGVWSLWRETDEQQLLFFANTSGVAVSAQVEAKAQVAGWENWSLESGENSPFAAIIEDGVSRFTLDLPPYGSALLVGSWPSSSQGATQNSTSDARSLPLDGAWNLRLDRPNALRLNRWEARAQSGPWRSVEALPLRHLDQRGGRGWHDQLDRNAGETVLYRRRVECEFVPDNLEILVENGAIAGDWTLSVNGREVSPSDFAPRVYNGEDKTSARVARFFRVGENTLELRVANAPQMGGLLTPLHLLGDFALIGPERRTLAPLPPTAPFNDLVAAGLPHFSGAAFYTRAVDLQGAQAIELPAQFGDIAQVRVDNRDLGTRAWSPYRWNCAPLSELVTVEIAVTNTLLPFVEGQTWNTQTASARSF